MPLSRAGRGSGALLFALSVACAAAYGWSGAGTPRLWTWVLVKGATVTCLALAAALAWRRPGAALLTAALACHATGDVLLEVAPRIAGLVAFLIGHLILVELFRRSRLRWPAVRGGAKLALGLLAVFLGTLGPTLAAAAPADLRLPVALYVAALGAMAALAQVTRFGPPVAAGALLFVASDALLGATWFGLLASATVARLVWPLYVTAQLAIAWGVLRSRPAVP